MFKILKRILFVLKEFLFETVTISFGVILILLFKYWNFPKESNIPGIVGISGTVLLFFGASFRFLYWFFHPKARAKRRNLKNGPTIVAFQN